MSGTASIDTTMGKKEESLELELNSLPQELLFSITSFLDAPSLICMLALNRNYKKLASSDGAGWKNLCRRLWKDKVFSPEKTESLIFDPSMPPTGMHAVDLEKSSYLDAYRISLEDGTNRHSIQLHELIFDAEREKGVIWNFRFKECAGPDWTSWDPWYNGRLARQMVLLRDGQVKQYISKDVDPSADMLLLPNAPAGQKLSNGAVVIEPPVMMGWRFASQPMDLPDRPQGAYIRFTVGGRDVPTYCVRRSPTGNWGFLAESCWGVYTSFTMPLRKETPRLRLRRTPSGNRWLPDTDNEDDENMMDDENEVTLADDSTFIISNEVQWREALLYNFGATVLPEGASATEDFDRMFGRQFHPRGVAAAQQNQGLQGTGAMAVVQAQAQVAAAAAQQQAAMDAARQQAMAGQHMAAPPQRGAPPPQQAVVQQQMHQQQQAEENADDAMDMEGGDLPNNG